VAVTAHGNTPGKINDLRKTPQPRLNNKLRSGWVAWEAQTR
jgi:hypothetical protein